MKVAIYPGSFNPWHDGHTDVLLKAFGVFDEVVVAIGINPAKHRQDVGLLFNAVEESLSKIKFPPGKDARVVSFNGLLVDEIKDFNYNYENKIQAVIRGLRGEKDLGEEKTQQYWNEDLGIAVPTFYVITDRKLSHISSSAIRMVNSFKK